MRKPRAWGSYDFGKFCVQREVYYPGQPHVVAHDPKEARELAKRLLKWADWMEEKC